MGDHACIDSGSYGNSTLVSSASTAASQFENVDDQLLNTRAERNRHALRRGPREVPYVPKRGYAEWPFGQIHFRDTGENDATTPPVVLIHQALSTSRQFTNVYDSLRRRGIRAIGVDMPGSGESDSPPFVPTVEDFAAVVPAVLDHLGISRAHVLGHHTGSMVATEVALQFPERVASLVINGPHIIVSEKERRKFLKYNEEKEINFVYKADGSHLARELSHRIKRWNTVHGESSADPKTMTRYVVEKFQGYSPFWLMHHAALIYDQGDAIEKIGQRTPTMILTNTGDTLYENAQLAREIRPDFAYRELKGGTGDVIDQMPEEWVGAVAGFLNPTLCRAIFGCL